MAEADGNRTRQIRIPDLSSFEDCGAHQDTDASGAEVSSARREGAR
ncbi:MAG: hypothetical protein QOC60_886 [Frankiaceae bacterium]|nr:hypothetical protein [Frankiaceae bacterium]MDQ1714941.1 hypothetical protein [Frankiaceae bacterium]